MHDKTSDEEPSFAGLAPRDAQGAMQPRPPRSEATLDPAVLRQLELDHEDALPLQRYYRLLMARRRQILSVAAVVVFVALIQAFTTTPLYRSEATLQIDPETPSILGNDSASDVTYGAKGMEEYLATQTRKLQTRNLARRVIGELDLASQPAFTEAASSGFFVERFKGTIAFFRRLFGSGEVWLIVIRRAQAFGIALNDRGKRITKFTMIGDALTCCCRFVAELFVAHHAEVVL